MSEYLSIENVIDMGLQVALRGVEDLNLIYMKNPKAGCTAAMQVLWKAASGVELPSTVEIHDVAVARFSFRLSQMPWCGNARIVTFVRHPLTRVVSAYKDKVLGRDDEYTRGRFCKRYGIDQAETVSFERFMKLIHEDPDPQTLDEHFKPQFRTILFPFIVPNFIGRVENLDRDLSKFTLQALGRESSRAKALNRGTGRTADEVGTFFAGSGDALERAIDLYRDDFRYFDYPLDIAEMAPGDYEPDYRPHAHPRLARLHELTRLRPPSQRSLDRDTARMLIADLEDGVASSREIGEIYAAVKSASGGEAGLRDIAGALQAEQAILTRETRIRLGTLVGLLESMDFAAGAGKAGAR